MGSERGAIEYRLQSALTEFWRGQIERILNKLRPGIPKSRRGGILDRLGPDFWEGEERELLAVVTGPARMAAEVGKRHTQGKVAAMGIGMDWTATDPAVAKWARKHCGELVTQVTKTTKRAVASLVSDWVADGTANLGDLTRRLADESSAFSPQRAKLIAITETSFCLNAGQHVTAQSVEKEGFFTWRKTWRTCNDGIVCDYCRDLHNVSVEGADTLFPGTDLVVPPLHPGCRCWCSYAPLTMAMAEEEARKRRGETPGKVARAGAKVVVRNVDGQAAEIAVEQVQRYLLTAAPDESAPPPPLPAGTTEADFALLNWATDMDAATQLNIMTTGRYVEDPDPDYEKGAFESHLIYIEGGGKCIAKPLIDEDAIEQVFGYGYEYLIPPLPSTNAEKAAYDVAVLMGYPDLVPPTVVRDIVGREMSVQAWVPGVKHLGSTLDLPTEELRKMTLLDIIIGNGDRHTANWAYDESRGRVVGFDHGLAFDPSLIDLSDLLSYQLQEWEEAGGDFWGIFTPEDFDLIERVLADGEFKRYILDTFGDDGDAVWEGIEGRCQAFLEHAPGKEEE